MKFRKKPVVIEARQLLTHNIEAIAAWCGGKAMPKEMAVAIDTLEGTMCAIAGDWVIQGVKGEFYPCKPDIFAATYEAVDDGSCPAHCEVMEWKLFPPPARGAKAVCVLCGEGSTS